MPHPDPLRQIKRLDQLVAYLRDELGWPIGSDSVEDVTYDYSSDELGLDTEHAAKIKEIKQLRPLTGGQPWGIFWVNFEKKRLPVVVLRRILANLVLKSRAGAKSADRPRWQLCDLLFISAYGNEDTDQREIAFAHFHQGAGDLPTLQVLGWDGADTPLKLDHVAQTLDAKLRWPANPTDVDAWRSQWSGAFRHRLGHVIRTADLLAETLAALARGIRDRCTVLMRAESDRGPLTKLFTAFQAALIHDLTPESFADTYAQTITYGLFTAAVNRTDLSGGTEATFVKADDMTLMARSTSPFLKEMLETFLHVGGRKNGVDFDELGIQDVVELLRGNETDLPAILRDFGNRTRGEDPVIHFYEHFLSAYNKKLKIQRGVFYTPQPVVSYIVRSVHELLQTEFGLEDGLASTVTWGEMIARSSRGNEAQTSSAKGKNEPPHVGCYGLKLPPLSDEPGDTRTISPDEPFVQILDPATGTATFLVEVIDVIFKTLKAKWDKGGLSAMPALSLSSIRNGGEGRGEEARGSTKSDAPLPSPRPARASRGEGVRISSFADYWNLYVPQHLLPRLHGYELLAAPYAIAHLKLGLKLTETGYRFGSAERARIYLTNALEPKVKQLPQIGFEPLAHEAQAVNEIKWYKRFTVVIGNPPYAGNSSNMTDAAQELVERYRYVNGEPLGERKLWLQNDYIKFLGLANRVILNTGVGCLGYITDNSYLDGPTFRGVRFNLLQDFATLNILNLHGSTKKMNDLAATEADQNVFDITQAVAVIHGIRKQGLNARCSTANLIGTRQSKYERLTKQCVGSVKWSELSPKVPFFQFVETNQDGESEYNSYFSIKAAFPLQSVGIQTSRDHLAIDFSKAELSAKVREFASPKKSDTEIRDLYFPGKKVGDYLPGDTRGWSLCASRKALAKLKDLDSEIVGIHYRPFDFRFVFISTLLVDWPRPEVTEQMLSGKNLGLCLLRKTENARDYDYFSVSRDTISNHQVSLKDGTYLLPLYIESSGDKQGLFAVEKGKRPNLSPAFLKAVSAALKLPQKGAHGLPDGVTPEDIFHYAYAVFHSPGYRRRYAEFLKIDFPRLPLTGKLELFRALARLGGELTALHLLEAPLLSSVAADVSPLKSPGKDQSRLTSAATIPKVEYVSGRAVEVEKVTFVVGRVPSRGESESRKTPAGGGGPTTGTVFIDKAQTTGFQGVREDVWHFHVGGYQVCEKWLKDRKGRTLSAADRAHYQKIVVALSETIRLMREIDGVIEQHGGWPLK